MGPFNLAVFSVVKDEGTTTVEGKATLHAGDYFSAPAVPSTNNLHAWKDGEDGCSCKDVLHFDCPINTTRAYRIPGGAAAKGTYSIGVNKADLLSKNGTLNIGSDPGDPEVR